MPKQTLFIGLGIVILVVVGLFVVKRSSFKSPDSDMNVENNKEVKEVGESSGSTTSSPRIIKEYTLSEVVKHNSKNDCWLVLEGSVYDVTSFIPSHPGGDAIVQGCGKDATELFETRPMGSGTDHSEQAEKLAQKYKIGILK